MPVAAAPSRERSVPMAIRPLEVVHAIPTWSSDRLSATTVPSPRRHAHAWSGVVRDSYRPVSRSGDRRRSATMSRTNRRTDPGSWRWSATLHVDGIPHAQPGGRPGRREAPMRSARPRQWGPFRIAAPVRRPEPQTDGVEDVFVGEVDVGQADLVALVEHGRAPQGQEHEQGQAHLVGIPIRPSGWPAARRRGSTLSTRATTPRGGAPPSSPRWHAVRRLRTVTR